MKEISEKQNKIKILSKWRSDTTLMFVILFLVAFSLIMVFSSSYYISFKRYEDYEYIFTRQVIWIILGIFAMYVVSRINYRIFLKFNVILYVITLALLIFILTKEDINNSKRWIEIVGGVRIQPSEFAKVSIILAMASIINIFKDHLDKLRVLIIVLLIGSIPIILVAIENLSTAIILMVIVVSMLFVSYKKMLKLVIIGVLVFLAIVIIFLNTEDYRGGRIETWTNSLSNDKVVDIQGAGYQIDQSIHAIGAGGLFGVGLGKSVQKTGVIPEAHNDIIFSIICDELGLFGGLSILILYFLVMWRMIWIINECNQIETILIVVGVMVHIGFQAIVNMGVVTELIPPTGVPLPFVSYGGSSLIVLFVEMGIVLNIGRENTKRIEGNGLDE